MKAITVEPMKPNSARFEDVAEPEYSIKVDASLGLLGVLLERATVIAKALEQVSVIGRRPFWEPRTRLVTGAGAEQSTLPLAAIRVRADRHGGAGAGWVAGKTF
jgi:hypothetical protein